MSIFIVNKKSNLNKILLPDSSINFPIYSNKDSKYITYQPSKDITSEDFILHDGPIYANGPLHIGHALNKILKDSQNRFYYLQGKNINMICGWDCHGLPIEYAVEKKYGKLDFCEMREKCREEAEFWINRQKSDLESYSLYSDLNQKYLTMSHESELEIIKQVYILLKKNLIYRANKPILWSCFELTSLAEAETELIDKEICCIDVRFDIKSGKYSGTSIVAWTTTPWNIYNNYAIAYSSEFTYSLIEIKDQKIWIISTQVQDFIARTGGQLLSEVILGSEFKDLYVENPDGKLVPMLHSNFVIDDMGTGFVHISPSHSLDDFYLAQQYNLKYEDALTDNGIIKKLNIHFTKSATQICQLLGDKLLASENRINSVICSWRSKGPLVYRATPQWFLNIHEIRDRMLDAINQVQWYPKNSINRIKSMIKKRPDWCISRQRAWGIPLAIFYNNSTNEPILDNLDQIYEFLNKESLDAWFTNKTDKIQPANSTKVIDILDVWLESGCSYKILENQFNIQKIDLYLEGSDQHRGWFQSSLALGCALDLIAPYKTVSTHGFTLDASGRKMSKSLNNVVDPAEIIQKYGINILRLICLSNNPSEDVVFSVSNITRVKEIAHRLRLTLRYTLSLLDNAVAEFAPMEQYVIHKMQETDQIWINSMKNHRPDDALNAINLLCCRFLSAIYFEYRKDTIYCDSIDTFERKSAIACMNLIFNYLVRWVNVFMPDLAQEAWECYLNKINHSIKYACLLRAFDHKFQAKDEIIDLYNNFYTSIRDPCNKAIEIQRSNSGSGILSSYDASLELKKILPFSENELANLLLVASVKYTDSEEISVTKSPYLRCDRCKFARAESSIILCNRCVKIINSY